MNVKGFIEVDALIALFICTTLSVLVVGFSYVRHHFEEVMQSNQEYFQQMIIDELNTIQYCEITYVPEDNSMDEEALLD